jgi:hypothetical protein
LPITGCAQKAVLGEVIVRLRLVADGTETRDRIVEDSSAPADQQRASLGFPEHRA